MMAFAFASTERRSALKRMEVLRFNQTGARPQVSARHSGRNYNGKHSPSHTSPLKQGSQLLLRQADLLLPVWVVTLFALAIAALLTLLASKVVSAWILPIIFVGGLSLPYLVIDSRAERRATAFIADYPSVLLATASSIKTGMTPYQALERATRLLPVTSLVRIESEQLLSALRRGAAKEQAVAAFGEHVRLPDLALFREAFLLVLENGGRFAPTLERLANVAKDRTTLIEHAKVTTSTMRMTANVLVILTPLIIGTVAIRTPDFWDLILHHRIANLVASTGLVLIAGGYATLRRMSSFKP